MDFWTLAGRGLMLLAVIYAISVPLVMAWSFVERRRTSRERRSRARTDRWTEV